MYMKKLLLSILFLLSLSILTGQELTFSKKSFQVNKARTIIPKAEKKSFSPKLKNYEAPVPGGKSAKRHTLDQKIKSDKLFPRIEKQAQYKNSGNSDLDPTIEYGLAAFRYIHVLDRTYNLGGGNPLDNTMAISNEGKLLMSVNSYLWGYDIKNDTALFIEDNGNVSGITFSQFAGPDIIKSFDEYPFDPKLIYDPNHDRFIFIFLSGRGPSDTKNVIGFSSSNNPEDPWHVYQITGNPQNTNHWTDYPAFSISEDELFLTINLIEEGVSWQNGFRGSLIWQVNLEDGYQGKDNLEFTMWDNIKHNGRLIRNLNPIQHANGPDGDKAYFISNRNFDIQNDTIFLLELTGKQDDPNTRLNLKVGQLDTPYGVPPNGRQYNTNTNDPTDGLQTNDARWLGGYYLNNQIQFVGNTKDFATGNAAVYHGFIDNVSSSTPSFTGTVIASDTMDFGYPNIVYAGSDTSCKSSSLIAFDHTNATFHPGISAIYYGKSKEYSSIVTVKKGESYLGTGQGYFRWGDYFGLQKKYNVPGEFWLSGFYVTSAHSSNTWMAKLKTDENTTQLSAVIDTTGIQNETCNISSSIQVDHALPPYFAIWNGDTLNQDTFSLNICGKQYNLTVVDAANCKLSKNYKFNYDFEKETFTIPQSNIYPNPFVNEFKVYFNLQEDSEIEFQIFNIEGQIVSDFNTYNALKGNNSFEFDTSALQPGIYFFVGKNRGKEFLNEKILKVN